MSFESDLFIYRPLATDSEAQLRSLQEEYSSVPSFAPVDDLHMTILTGNSHSKYNSPSKFVDVMSKGPLSSLESYSAAVTEARVDRRTKVFFRVAIKLMLDITAIDSLQQEHEKFKKAMINKDATARVPALNHPHVTIGYLSAEHNVGSVKEAAEAFTGTVLNFGPTESNRGVARRSFSNTPEVSTPMAIDAPVLTVAPGSIPQGLLSSLRPRN